MSILPPVVALAGPFGPALMILGFVVLALTVRTVWMCLGPGFDSASALRDRSNAVVFWGGASAVLGFLGQAQSTYLALNAILVAPEIDPGVVAQGFVISFIPALMGLGIFAFSGVASLGLRMLGVKVEASPG